MAPSAFSLPSSSMRWRRLGTKDQMQALKTAVYSMTAYWGKHL
jgi:hypothetical protein